MALSELDMMNLWAKQLTGYKSQWERLFGFGYAVEAEGQKQYEALIRQMVEALDTAFHQTCSVGRPKDWEQIRNALHSARARLESKP